MTKFTDGAAGTIGNSLAAETAAAGGVAGLVSITGALSSAQGTLTAAQPNLSSTATWNDAGTIFTGWKLDVTETLRADNSVLFDIQSSGLSKLSLSTKQSYLGFQSLVPTLLFGDDSGGQFYGRARVGTGNAPALVFTAANGTTTGNGGPLSFNAGEGIGGNSAGGALNLNAGPGVGTGAGGAVIVNTGTGGLSGNGGAFTVVTGADGGTQGNGGDINLSTGQGAGTGRGGNINLLANTGSTDNGQINFSLRTGLGNDGVINFGSQSGTTPGVPTTVFWKMVLVAGVGGHLLAGADSTYDIGASGATRPRDLFLGRKLYLDYTNTATVGAVTISKPSGRVRIAAAGTSVVVTNTLVTAASHVIAVVSMNDATARVTSVVPAAGSFTINSVAVTAETTFDFVVFNAD